jgi:hypothetical protein
MILIFILMVTIDACFVCLMPTRSRVCGRCSIHAHSKCWTNFLDHSATGFAVDNRRCVKCPQCTESITMEPYFTRSVVGAMRTRTNFIQIVTQGLVAIQSEGSESERSRMCEDLFEYICDNVSVIATYTGLLVVIKHKLEDLDASGWTQACGYYARLFQPLVG